MTETKDRRFHDLLNRFVDLGLVQHLLQELACNSIKVKGSPEASCVQPCAQSAHCSVANL
jgi:hypothetical protein